MIAEIDALKTTIKIYTLSHSVVNGVPQAEEWTEKADVIGLLWEGVPRDVVLKSKILADVDGIFVCDYNSILAGIKDDAKFIDESGTSYRILHIDNPGRQNKTLEFYYKRENGF